jgi:hypothetical protein
MDLRHIRYLHSEEVFIASLLEMRKKVTETFKNDLLFCVQVRFLSIKKQHSFLRLTCCNLLGKAEKNSF